MNFSFSVGVLASLGLVVVGILSGNNGSLNTFFDIPSLWIVFGGVFGTLFACYSFKELRTCAKYLKVLFLSDKKYVAESYVAKLKDLAQEARMNGILALENKAEGIDNEFLKKALLMVVDSVDSEKIRNTLELSIEAARAKDMVAHGFFSKGASLAPAFGMIGTLIGLVKMLDNMSDYSSIGSDMGVALITTFYGTMLANIVFVPVANKVMLDSNNKVFCKELIMEGVLDIQAGESPQYIEDKLYMMLSRNKQAPGKKRSRTGKRNYGKKQ